MSDLDKLIAAAGKEQRQRKAAALAAKPYTRPRKTPIVGLAAVGLVLVAILATVALSFLPVSEEIIRSDLNAALNAAQSAVEDYHAVNGKLPERVPVPTLAPLVHLEPIDGGYRIRISMNGMTLTRDNTLPAR